MNFTEAVSKIASTLKPRQIILFGSRAINESNVDSDYDLAIIIETGDRYEITRQAYSLIKERTVPIDLLIFQREFFEERLKKGITLFKRIHETGKVIYAS